MYPALLVIHSLLRWVVLALAVLTVVRAASALRSGRAYAASDAQVGLGLMATMDLQLLLGLLLYFVASPLVQVARANMASAMKEPGLRFWVVEHLTVMLLAVVAAHVGRVLTRKASDDRAKHRRMLVSAGIALVLICVGMPWPWASYGRPLFRLF